jgi:hypothetical protein
MVLLRHIGACLALACFILIGPAVDRSAAQEATTAPTCTGCSRAPVVKRTPKPRAAPRAAPRTPAGPAAARTAVSADGRWAGVSTGPCIPTWRWTLQVSDGVVSGSGATGQVSRAGAIRGVMKVLGKAYNFVGRMGGTTGSGTWRSVECSGAWTAVRS